MPRARKGSGSIAKRTLTSGKTVYDLRVTYPPDEATGKSRQVRRRSEATTRTDAQGELNVWLAEVYGGETVIATKDTLGQLLDRWLDDEAASRVRASTLTGYRETIATHVTPRIGTHKADSLTPADVHRWLATMEREGVGARSRQLALARLKQTLAWAREMELIRRNVAEKIRPPKASAREGRALTHAETTAFLAAANDDYYWPLWQVLLMTGLRRGEALGLRWSDLDLDHGLLSVRQQVRLVKGEDGKKRPTIQEVKTPAARRTLDLDKETIESLVKISSLHGAEHEDGHMPANGKARDLVFCTAHGTPHNPTNLYDHFAAIKAKAGITGRLIPHDLRHSHGSQCILAGWPIEVVSKRLGHANASITLRIYSHLMQGYSSKAAIDALAEALRPDDLPELDG